MKKFMYLFLAVALSLAACDDKDEVQNVLFDQLPTAAQQFVETHFLGVEVVSVLKEWDDLGWDYIVTFSNGSWIEFDGDGDWETVTCYQTGVPNSVIPTAILTYVQTNYPSNIIVQIEKSLTEYDVELNSGVELIFDKSGNIISVDYD